jgi:site-specific recombinase XerD
MKLNDLITQYVSFRKTLGERCRAAEEILQSFCRTVGSHKQVSQIRVQTVATFLAGTGPITERWHKKHSALKGFFRFAVSRGHLDKAPLPTIIPKHLPPRSPYVFSRAEIRRLLEAIPLLRHRCALIESPTLRAILLLLYGAGLRQGEALRLSVTDVDLAHSLLTVRDSKFFKSRLIPISDHLTGVLRDYVRWRAANHPSASAENHFFISRRGTVILKYTLEGTFKRLRKHADLRGTDSSLQQPRLHGLRHAFAVHRLTEWYRQGADVQRLVHHLSVYLGHAHLRHTQVYLTMIPELLQQAGKLFERYAHKEGNHA